MGSRTKVDVNVNASHLIPKKKRPQAIKEGIAQYIADNPPISIKHGINDWITRSKEGSIVAGIERASKWMIRGNYSYMFRQSPVYTITMVDLEPSIPEFSSNQNDSSSGGSSSHDDDDDDDDDYDDYYFLGDDD